MYFTSLDQLETLLSGHATAFQQLGALGRDASFNVRFAEWLRGKTGVSGAAGWAHAISDLAKSEAVGAEEIFARYVNSFLGEWGAAAPGTVSE